MGNVLSALGHVAAPSPALVRRWAPWLLAILAVPKAALLIPRLTTLGRPTETDDDEEDDDLKDPTALACRNACTAAVLTIREAWVVISAHCTEVSPPREELVLKLLSSVESVVAKHATVGGDVEPGASGEAGEPGAGQSDADSGGGAGESGGEAPPASTGTGTGTDAEHGAAGAGGAVSSTFVGGKEEEEDDDDASSRGEHTADTADEGSGEGSGGTDGYGTDGSMTEDGVTEDEEPGALEGAAPPAAEDDEDADDAYLKQWSKSLCDQVQVPLGNVLNSKADDEDAEAPLRECARQLYWLFIALAGCLEAERLRRALDHFRSLDRRFGAAEVEHLTSSRTADTLSMHREASGSSESSRDESARVEAAVRQAQETQDKMDFLRSDRDRAMISLRRIAMLEGEETESIRYFMWMAMEPSVVSAEGVRPERDHERFWNGPDSWERRVETLEWQTTMRPAADGFDELLKTVPRACVTMARTSLEAEEVLGSMRRERMFKLFRFLSIVVGTTKERALLVISWVLSSLQAICTTTEINFRTRLLVKTLSGAARAAVGRAGSLGSTSGAGVASKFGGLVFSIVLLKVLQSLLQDALEMTTRAGQGSVRNGLCERMARHLLSQDLADAVDAKRDRRRGDANPREIMTMLQDEDAWNCSLGKVLAVPQQIISSTMQLISSGTLLWAASPQLTLTMMGVILSCRWLLRALKQVRRWIRRRLGLDKHTFKYENLWEIEDALEDFEDMRVNAKELSILRTVAKVNKDKDEDEKRGAVIPSLFRPLELFVSDVPSLACVFIGGKMALGGTVDAPDLTDFAFRISDVIRDGRDLYTKISNLWSMEDRTFSMGFSMMTLFDRKPKIGLDGGWKPESETDKATGECVDDGKGARGDGVGGGSRATILAQGLLGSEGKVGDQRRLDEDGAAKEGRVGPGAPVRLCGDIEVSWGTGAGGGGRGREGAYFDNPRD